MQQLVIGEVYVVKGTPVRGGLNINEAFNIMGKSHVGIVAASFLCCV